MRVDSLRPLLGMRILITRPSEQSQEISERIESFGGVPVQFPTIRVTPASDYSRLDRALYLIKDYHWLVFTSANGVRRFFERAIQNSIRFDDVPAKLAAVGPSTASAIKSYGLKVSFIPTSYLTKRLALELPHVESKKILLVRAEGTDDTMSSILTRRGAKVDEIHAYRVLANEYKGGTGKFDAVLFTSPSTASGFKTIIGREAEEVDDNVIVCCIGPVTARAARALGFRVDVVSSEHTTEGLVKALVEKVKSR